MTHVEFSNVQIKTSNSGFDCAIEKNPKQFINALIIDTENAVRLLDIRIHSTFRYLTTRKIKQIADTNTCNTVHKRHQCNLKQIKTRPEQNNLTIAKAVKGRTMVIIHKDTLKQNIDTFIQENQIMQLNKDPTESFQKQIQQTIHKCNSNRQKPTKILNTNKTHGTKT